MLKHRFFTFCLVGCLAIAFAGCEGKKEEAQQKGDSPQSSNEKNNQNSDKNAKQTGKPIVAKKIEAGEMQIRKTPYGKTATGEEVTEFTCTNRHGFELKLITYGATVTSIKTPDREGKFENITLNCKDLAAYEKHGSYFGCSVGRYCNRIANGKFSIDGKEYTLATNNEPHHLHGGKVGFNRKVWDAKEIKTDTEVGVKFSLTSEDGDEGYPGTLKVTVDYYLTNDNELVVDFSASTDAPTHVNLTNHNYWNLSGDFTKKIVDHQLKVEADQFVAADDTLIPTGKLADVKGTSLDFTEFHKMGERLDDAGLTPPGYDHCFVLRKGELKMIRAAVVKDPASGRVMEISTTQPGLQFYTGNFLDGTEGSGGFNQHCAFCLETQHYPDTPNQPSFPTTLLRPGQSYSQKTVHKFSVESKP